MWQIWGVWVVCGFEVDVIEVEEVEEVAVSISRLGFGWNGGMVSEPYGFSMDTSCEDR